MSSQLSIELSKLRLHGGHGLYAGEAVWDSEFEVNLQIEIVSPQKETLELTDTIDYAKVYQIVKNNFSQRTALLENLAIKICDELAAAFPGFLEMNISIKKLNPPIENFVGAVGINYKRVKE